MENETNCDKVVEALNEWKYANESRSVFAMIEDEDGNKAIMGKGKDLIISLARALTHEERAFLICKAALDLATYVKSFEANAKERVEE